MGQGEGEESDRDGVLTAEFSGLMVDGEEFSLCDVFPGNASAAPALPLPWIVLINQVDGKPGGRPYYHNPHTYVSQWEYPQSAPLPPGPPPQMTPEDMMQQQVQATRQMQEQMLRLQQMQANMQAQQEPSPRLLVERQAQQTSMTPYMPPEEMMQTEQEEEAETGAEAEDALLERIYEAMLQVRAKNKNFPVHKDDEWRRILHLAQNMPDQRSGVCVYYCST